MILPEPKLTPTWKDVALPKECLYKVSNDDFLTSMKEKYEDYKQNKEFQFAREERMWKINQKITLNVEMMANLTCNQDQTTASHAVAVKEKYDDYASKCETQGMWTKEARPELLCIYRQLVTKLDIEPYDVILDWGGGCGHQLGLFSELLGTFSINVDLSAAGVEWGNTHHKNMVGCAQDGTNLTNFQNNTVDVVISFAALYFIAPEKQCGVLREFLRILKPGGRMWIGWVKVEGYKDYKGMSCDDLHFCLTDEVASGLADVTTCQREHTLFGVTVYNWPIHASLIITKPFYGSHNKEFMEPEIVADQVRKQQIELGLEGNF